MSLSIATAALFLNILPWNGPDLSNCDLAVARTELLQASFKRLNPENKVLAIDDLGVFLYKEAPEGYICGSAGYTNCTFERVKEHYPKAHSAYGELLLKHGYKKD